jgi:glycosyltransferase involved in cell wall biosynthesis
MSLAYLVGAHVKPDMLEGFRSGTKPRPEYFTFLQRNDATLLHLGDLDASRNRLARFFVSKNQFSFALSALALAARPRFSAFLTSGEDVGMPLALLALLRARRAPIYVITHGSYFGSGKFRTFVQVLKRTRTVHFLCLSETLRQRLIREFEVPEDRAHNTSYYLDSDYFSSRATPAQPPIVASVGAANRDYRTLVKAAEPLGVRMKIAADSAWFKIKVDVQDDVLPPNIELGSFDYAGLRELYAASTFVVVPLYRGKHASGYTAIVEAMAMARPVIATDTEGNSDFLIHGENGFYVEPGDVEGLRGKMKWLLDNPEQAQAMGQRARARVEQFFSIDAYCARVEAVIRGDSRHDPQLAPQRVIS